MNSVWIELPLIVNVAPERWTLPSTLSLIISLANIFPILVVFLRWKFGQRLSEIPFIYVIIIVGILACFAIGLFWDYTAYIYGKERSVPLLLAVFALAILDCTSSLVFYDYMKRFQAKYLQAMFIGEGFTGTLPTLIAIVQGVGGEAKCVPTNDTAVFRPIYSKPRFGVSMFFYLVTGIIVISLLAFVLLRLTSLTTLAKAKEKKQRKLEGETDAMLAKTNGELSLSTRKSMTKKQFYILQAFNVINSAILFGCLPTLITYSVLPYGQQAFYYCSIIYPISYPLSALCGIIRPVISIWWVTIGSIIGCLVCAFIIVLAFQSPCPIWADTVHGGIIMITAWFLSSFILSYVRIASGNWIKLAYAGENGLFYYGVSVQMGLVFGSIPMYLVINIFELLQDRSPCVTYCLRLM